MTLKSCPWITNMFWSNCMWLHAFWGKQTLKGKTGRSDHLPVLLRRRGRTVRPTQRTWRLSLSTSKGTVGLHRSWLLEYQWAGNVASHRLRYCTANKSQNAFLKLCTSTLLWVTQLCSYREHWNIWIKLAELSTCEAKMYFTRLEK